MQPIIWHLLSFSFHLHPSCYFISLLYNALYNMVYNTLYNTFLTFYHAPFHITILNMKEVYVCL